MSVGSFCDELTVVFCSFVCSFSTNSYAFKEGGEGGAGFCFLFFVYLERMWAGRKKPSLYSKKEQKNDLHDGERRK